MTSLTTNPIQRPAGSLAARARRIAIRVRSRRAAPKARRTISGQPGLDATTRMHLLSVGFPPRT